MANADGLAGVRRQLLKEIGLLLEQRLADQALAALAEEARRQQRQQGSDVAVEGGGPCPSPWSLGKVTAPKIPKSPREPRAGGGPPPSLPPLPEPGERPKHAVSLLVKLGDDVPLRSAAEEPCNDDRTADNEESVHFQSSSSSQPPGQRRGSFGSASMDSLVKFRSAARAVLFSRRLREVITYKEPTPRPSENSADQEEPLELPATIQREASYCTTVSNVSKLSISPVWAEEVMPMGGSARRTRRSKSLKESMRDSSFVSRGTYRSDNSRDRRRSRTLAERMIFKPTSPCCMLWDLWTTLAIAYDLVHLPISEAFNIKSPLLDSIELVTACTWLCDMLLSFLRGYVDTQLGTVEMRPRRIACHYLKTWFCLDATVVALDFFLQWLTFSEWLKFFTFLRFFRLLRLLRVIRIIKVSSRLATLGESLNLQGSGGGSEKIAAVFKIVKQLVLLVMINHFIACGWYALGHQVSNGWVDIHLASLTGIAGGPRHTVYLYFTAFHWSITQFTPASMEVFPTNTGERVYTVCAIFMGLVMFSSFVSSMTQSMTHLRQLTMIETQNSQHVRRYISDNHISSELASRIMGVIRLTRAERRKRLKINDVEIFAGLPQSLQAKLHEEVFAPVICSHRVFGNLRALDGSRFLRLCLEGISERCVSRSEEVFLLGTPGDRMYFITGGKLAYSCEYMEDDNGVDPDVELDVGMRVAEVALWAKWEHRGRLAALQQSELLQVRAEAFQATVITSCVAVQMQTYARLFVAKSANACGSSHNVTDLWGNDDEVKAIADRAFRIHAHRKASVVAMMLPDDPGAIFLQRAFDGWKDYARSRHDSCGGCCCWCVLPRRRGSRRRWSRPSHWSNSGSDGEGDASMSMNTTPLSDGSLGSRL